MQNVQAAALRHPRNQTKLSLKFMIHLNMCALMKAWLCGIQLRIGRFHSSTAAIRSQWDLRDSEALSAMDRDSSEVTAAPASALTLTELSHN